jgi:hypothetical protein
MAKVVRNFQSKQGYLRSRDHKRVRATRRNKQTSANREVHSGGSQVRRWDLDHKRTGEVGVVARKKKRY